MSDCPTTMLRAGRAHYEMVDTNGKKHAVELRFEYCLHCHDSAEAVAHEVAVQAVTNGAALETDAKSLLMAAHIVEVPLIAARDNKEVN